jgi:hypothetical protein
MTQPVDRRECLARLGAGFGTLALRAMLGNEAAAAESKRANPLSVRAPHHFAKAKSVIFLFMYGGPSHVDLFDPKPALAKWQGKPIPVFNQEDVFRKGSKNSARSVSRSTASPGSTFANSIRISRSFPMNSASSARCTPRATTTARRCFRFKPEPC